MLGVYFSGTGNTKFCVEEFVKEMDATAKSVSIEDDFVLEQIAKNDFIVFGYPIYFSNLPKIVNDFIFLNKTIFTNKKIFIIATMGLFSGDGTGVGARLLKKSGAKIVGGLHLKMPDCIADEKVLKKSLALNKKIVFNAKNKIQLAVSNVKDGEPVKEGLGILYHLAGLFGQRLWFFNKTKKYSDKIKIDTNKCIGCGLCVKQCPMKNLSLANEKAVQINKCTMCYRCISSCPKQAITLLGSKVIEQSKIEKYL